MALPKFEPIGWKREVKKNDSAPIIFREDYKPLKVIIRCPSADLSDSIKNYWHSYPEARLYFKNTASERLLFYNEYVKLNMDKQCSYTDFELFTFSIN